MTTVYTVQLYTQCIFCTTFAVLLCVCSTYIRATINRYVEYNLCENRCASFAAFFVDTIWHWIFNDINDISKILKHIKTYQNVLEHILECIRTYFRTYIRAYIRTYIRTY